MIEVDDNVLPFAFKKLQVNLSLIEQLVTSALKNLPKVSGGNLMLSQKASRNINQSHNDLERT